MHPTARLSRARRMLHDLRLLSRPLMWVVPLTPFVIGYLMAHRQPGAHPEFCQPSSFDCTSKALALIASLVVWGPLISLAVLAINDVHDVDGDSRNSRRVGSPVSSGRVTVRAAFVIAHVAGAAAIAIAAIVRPDFALVTAVFLTLGWLYSIPPVRLKERPGFDVAVNALGDGGLSILAGWTSTRSFHGFPWSIFVIACFAAAALYVPATVADYQSDLAAGYSTFVVRFGPRFAAWLGLGFWTVAGIGCLSLALMGSVLPHRSTAVLLVSTPTLVGLYHWLLGRRFEQRQLQRGMAIIAYVASLPLVIIVLQYMGVG